MTKIILIAILVSLVTIQPTGVEPEVKLIKITIPMHDKQSNKKLARKLAAAGYGWTGKEWKCLDSIIENESHYNHKADNKRSTAYGVMQMLGEKEKDPTIQFLRGYKYLSHRYETPCKAWRFHTRHNYY